ncbi:MAG: ABC transporter permease [Rhizobiaceae bacterium]
MLIYTIRRLLGLIPILAAVLLLTFTANHLTPGDPILMMLDDRSGDEALAASLRHQYGLDLPLWQQFFNYISGILVGDLGLSYRYVGVPVAEVIAPGLAISPLLAALAMLIAIPVGVSVGIFTALRHNSWADTSVMFILLIGISVPNFAMASFLVYLLSIRLDWFPVAGWGNWDQVVLPVILLALHPSAYLARLSRTYMLEVLHKDYIRTARAKGLRERLVIYRHALRNVLVPLVTTIGIIFGVMITSTFVVETIFNIPGLGRMAIDSIFARDYPVTIAIVLVFTVTYSIINLAIDLLYGLIDPRIRVQGKAD